jgi:hypothetical protein
MKKYLIIEHDYLGNDSLCLTEIEIRQMFNTDPRIKNRLGFNMRIVGQFRFSQFIVERLNNMPIGEIKRLSDLAVKLPEQPDKMKMCTRG